jgi:hypothetical protein
MVCSGVRHGAPVATSGVRNGALVATSGVRSGTVVAKPQNKSSSSHPSATNGPPGAELGGAAARADMTGALEKGCGQTLTLCSRQDESRFADPAKNRAFYEATQTYGLPAVYEQTAGRTEDVRHLAPEAGYLLTAAFPYLTLAQADAILTKTEGPGGGFLDDGSAFGVYSRLDL